MCSSKFVTLISKFLVFNCSKNTDISMACFKFTSISWSKSSPEVQMASVGKCAIFKFQYSAYISWNSGQHIVNINGANIRRCIVHVDNISSILSN